MCVYRPGCYVAVEKKGHGCQQRRQQFSLAFRSYAVFAVIVLALAAATGCDKVNEWLDLGQDQKDLPPKRDPSKSVKPLRPGERRFDPQPQQIEFGTNWQRIFLTP